MVDLFSLNPCYYCYIHHVHFQIGTDNFMAQFSNVICLWIKGFILSAFLNMLIVILILILILVVSRILLYDPLISFTRSWSLFFFAMLSLPILQWIYFRQNLSISTNVSLIFVYIIFVLVFDISLPWIHVDDIRS